MTTAVTGCKFCDIVNYKKDLHLKSSEKCIIVRDIKPKTAHHFLAIIHDMEKTGRDFLRTELKAKGEADTVEDMLRIGFHYPPLISVNHLHMHILYPIRELGFIPRLLTFRPGKIFRTTSEVIEELSAVAGLPDPFKGNPAKDDQPKTLPAHAVSN